jgi:hypothetical protein
MDKKILRVKELRKKTAQDLRSSINTEYAMCEQEFPRFLLPFEKMRAKVFWLYIRQIIS